MKIISLVFSFMMCINLNAQKGKVLLSNWIANGDPEINVPTDSYTYIKKGKLFYYISNDNNNIFINMKVDDPVTQSRILSQGLTVWINMDAKRAKTTGVRFPIGSENSRGQSRLNASGNKINTDRSDITPNSLANTIELLGFISEEARLIPADNADNFRGSVKYDSDGALRYQMILPLVKLPVRNSKDGDGAMPFNLGIEYGTPISGGPGGSGAQGSASGRSSRGSPKGMGRPPDSDLGGGMPSPNVAPTTLMWIRNIKLATDK